MVNHNEQTFILAKFCLLILEIADRSGIKFPMMVTIHSLLLITLKFALNFLRYIKFSFIFSVTYCFKEQHNAMININFSSSYFIPFICYFHTLAHLIFATTLWDNSFQHFSSTDKLTEAQSDLQFRLRRGWWCWHLNPASSGLPSMGSHRVGHDWSDLAAAAATV